MKQEMRVKVLDSKVFEVGQGPTDTHSPLVTICVCLRKKIYFLLTYVYFFFKWFLNCQAPSKTLSCFFYLEVL